MAIGHADPDAVENTLRTNRVPAREFVSFTGFEEFSGGTFDDPSYRSVAVVAHPRPFGDL